MAGYDLALTRARIEDVDFIEACDRIVMDDEWFPTAARIIAVTDQCARERRQRERTIAASSPRPAGKLVCPYCHGARWVRFGGYSPVLTAQGGRDTERIGPCPHCTAGGVYYADKEREVISNEGGVKDPAADAGMPDMSRTTWRVPRTPEGRVDMEALYRESRVLRGLDPNVDARPAAVPGFKTMRQAMATTPERELVGVGADDDLPF